MSEYDLPPLPAHWEHGLIEYVRSWGRAAVEADRKRTAELISVYQGKVRALEAENYSFVSDLDEQQCPDFWAWLRHAYREPENTTYTVYNMEVAYQAGRASVEADRKRRGEPVAVPTKTQIDDAMCKVSMPFFPDETRDGTEWIIQQFVKELWKIAAPQPQQIPEGYKLVPIEPTPEMLNIPCAQASDRFVYRDMILAAPTPPTNGTLLYTAPQTTEPDVLPGEAIFGFAAWLTILKTPVTFSECHGASIGADLAAAYNTSQGFIQVREDFHKRLKPYPKDEPSQPAEPVAWIVDHIAADPQVVFKQPQIPECHLAAAEVKITPLCTASQIPEGYKLVPIEPTPEMMRAGCQVPLNKAARHNLVYKAMLEAAPKVKS